MEGSLSPKRLNGIANEHNPSQRAGLQYAMNSLFAVQIIRRKGIRTNHQKGTVMRKFILLLGSLLLLANTAHADIFTLAPNSATNVINSNHTVTFTLTRDDFTGIGGVKVFFNVTSGPNVGAVGTCSVNADCSTDANGNVSFTYTSNGVVGTDTIQARPDGYEIDPPEASKEWIEPAASRGAPGLNAWGLLAGFLGFTLLGILKVKRRSA
jgi:hypothetical protein